MNPLTNIKNVIKMNDRELEMGVAGTKSSWHYQYRDSAWIFLGGLPFELTEGDILSVFSQFGEIVHINLIRDHETGKSKGFGFLCYMDQRSTVLTVDNLNGIKLCGRTVRVDHVETYKLPKDLEKLDDDRKRLFLEGCAPKVLEPDPMSEEEEDTLPVEKKPKKSKKSKQKKKKKKRKRETSSSNSSDSASESDEDRRSSKKGPPRYLRDGLKTLDLGDPFPHRIHLSPVFAPTERGLAIERNPDPRIDPFPRNVGIDRVLAIASLGRHLGPGVVRALEIASLWKTLGPGVVQALEIASLWKTLGPGVVQALEIASLWKTLGPGVVQALEIAPIGSDLNPKTALNVEAVPDPEIV
eukprot:snap_masked-scaffold1518_size37722-processed-gene-0.8 protein:Tk01683 transcript:snap_masked-scaffold1518_size37722-processed-gene-0.8-mRNA-1 annotation:"rna-binding motif x-linked 2"